MAGKLGVRILQRSTGPINEIASGLRQCITQGIRCCSSTSGSRNKIVGGKGDGSNIPKHVASSVPPISKNRRYVRNFCETVSEPNQLQQLFNQILLLPERHQIESIDCVLYWLSYYDKIDAGFELKTLMEEHGISKSYSTYSCLASLYAKSNHAKNYKSLFEEMTRDGLTLKARHYAPFVEAAAQKGDLMGAFRFLDDLRQSGVVHIRNTDTYIELIRACIGQDSRQLQNKVLELFQEFRDYRDLFSVDALEVIKKWFDR